MKLYITGSVAGGKTTLAKRLSEEISVPFHELDCVVYDGSSSPRRKRTPQEQMEVIHQIDAQGDWIVEGTYRKSCHDLFDLADRVVFYDPPLYVRRCRILKRFLRQKLGIEKSHYKPTFHMLRCMFKWTVDFEKSRPEFERMLAEHSHKLTVIKSDGEAHEFVRLIKSDKLRIKQNGTE